MLRRHNHIGSSIRIIVSRHSSCSHESRIGMNTHERTTRTQRRFTGGEKGRGEAPTSPSARPFLLLRQLSFCISNTIQCCVVFRSFLFGLVSVLRALLHVRGNVVALSAVSELNLYLQVKPGQGRNGGPKSNSVCASASWLSKSASSSSYSSSGLVSKASSLLSSKSPLNSNSSLTSAMSKSASRSDSSTAP